MRSFGRPDKKAYRLAAKAATGAASAYAEANCAKYFEFQYVWPEAMNRLESDQLLSEALVRSAMLRAQDVAAAAPAPAGANAPAGEPAAPAPVPVPHADIDAGMTTQIRLDMED